jgi:hypothetical protein
MAANQTTFLFVFQRSGNRPFRCAARKSNGRPDGAEPSRTAPLKNKKNVSWGVI